MNRLALALAALAFIINPSLACSPSEDPDWTYSESDMRTAIEGRWQISIRKSDGSVTAVTLDIAESGAPIGSTYLRSNGRDRAFIRAAAACGSRTFVRNAGACLDASSMALSVTYAEGDESYSKAPLSGQYMVPSRIFTQGDLDLDLGTLHVSATLKRDGTYLFGAGIEDMTRVP
jgi:hypothetical protein